MLYQHLVFYDGQCGLCDRIVQLLLAADKKQQFAFAPLQGETAKEMLIHLSPEQKDEDSLILIENFQSKNPRYYLLGKGAFRIAWLLGGWWAIPGLIQFFPGFLYNWGYRIVASQRHKLFKSNSCQLPDPKQKGRFLP